MATLTNQNQWYDVDTQGPISTTISGYTANWTNVIQARWTSRSGTIYSVQYRCVLRKNSGSLNSNTSSYNGYSVDGTGATEVSSSNTTINFSDIGDNVIATTSGSINGTSGTVTGGVKLGYYGTTWGGTGLSGSITLPNPYVAPTTPTISATATSPTSITITYGTTSFGVPSTGTVTLYGGTTASPTTSIDTTNTTGNKTFTFSGLSPETTYYFRARANNGQLNSNYSTEISVTTPLDKGLYGSVNDEAKKVTKIYGAVRELIGISGSITSQHNLNSIDYNVLLSQLNSHYKNIVVSASTAFLNRLTLSLSYRNTAPKYFATLYLYLSNGTYIRPINMGFSTVQIMKNTLANWGLYIIDSPLYGRSDVVTLQPTYTPFQTKTISKLYGSVNGEAKRIF